MKIHFLGTNGWYTTPTGNTPCILIDSRDHYVIFDAGNGLYRIDDYIKEEKPIFLFISHFHLDHVEGLAILNKFALSQGIDIYISEGRSKDFTTLVNPPYMLGPDLKAQYHLKTEVRLHEVKEENISPFPIICKQLYHAYTNHGYRIELEGKIIAYSGDTGVGENSYTLFKNADLLIHECSKIKKDPENTWGHTDSLETAQLAKDVAAKQLVLTHFDPTKYTTLALRDEAEKKAKSIFPNTTAAKDGMIITL